MPLTHIVRGRTMKLNRETDGWHLEFINARVQLIQIDFRLSFLVSEDSDEAWAHIETAGKLKTGAFKVPFVPENTRSLAPFLDLFNIGVTSMQITQAGKLTFEFSNKQLLEVCANEAYEAWQVAGKVGKDSFMFVCAPGGEVVHFSESNVYPSKLASDLN
jgi:hypothetical protein